jgi:hypothetical protein
MDPTITSAQSRQPLQITRAPELKLDSLGSIHLPVYNEKRAVPRLFSACAVMAENYGPIVRYIVVIDDSDDDDRWTDRKSHITAYEFRNRPLDGRTAKDTKLGHCRRRLKTLRRNRLFSMPTNPPPDFLTRSLVYFLQNDAWDYSKPMDAYQQ